MTQTAIPAVWMRGGTSKGLFIEPAQLPSEADARNRMLLRLMGSPDPYGTQMDGLGGGTSSTSKVALVNRSERADTHIDFLFGHVAVNKSLIDWSGSCGNLIAAVALYAVEAGWAPVEGDVARVNIWQANTATRIEARVPLVGGVPAVTGPLQVDGIPALDGGGHADIRIRYLQPADRPLRPTGNNVDWLTLRDGRQIAATLVNAGNPTIFVHAADLGLSGTELPDVLESIPGLAAQVEELRAAGAVAMGLVRDAEAAAQRPATPKLAVVAPPVTHRVRGGREVAQENIHLVARIWSMGRAHHAFTGTGAVSLAAAVALEGTVPAEAAGGARTEMRFGHAGGSMTLTVDVEDIAGRDTPRVSWVETHRSARRLMQGEVLVPA